MNRIEFNPNPVRVPSGRPSAQAEITWEADDPCRLEWRDRNSNVDFDRHDPPDKEHRRGPRTKPSKDMRPGDVHRYRLVQPDGTVVLSRDIVAVGIKLSENPVVFGPNVNNKTLTAKWTTGDANLPGKLFFQEDGEFENQVDPTGNTVQWQGTYEHPLSRTPPDYEFPRPFWLRLKSAKPNEPAQVLAEVRVTCTTFKESVTAKVADAVYELGLVQAIRYLRIQPGPDYVRFTFNTTQPTVPILAVRTSANDPSTNVATSFPVLYGQKTDHELFVQGLPQRSKLFFELIAGGSGNSDVVKGSFWTGWRDVDVVFENVLMPRLQNPKVGGANGVLPSEVRFSFGTYRGADGESLDPGRSLGSTPYYKLFEGFDVDVTRRISLTQCPRRLSLWVRAFVDRSEDSKTVWDDITGFFSGEPFTDGTRFYPPTKLPDPKQRPSHGLDTLDEWATAQHEFTLPDARKDQEKALLVGFGLNSGLWQLQFSATGHFEIWSGIPREQTVMATFPKVKDNSKALSPGGGSIVPWTGRKMFLSLAPDGTLFHRPAAGPDQAAHLSASSDWTPIGRGLAGPLTIAPGADKQLYLLGRGPRGTVLAQRWIADKWQPSGTEWLDLGGSVRGSIAAVQAPRAGLHLFAVTPDHKVCYRSYDGRGGKVSTRGWVNLGGQVREAIAAASSPDGAVDVFALNRTGSVLHKSLRGSRWAPAGDRWEDLGGKFDDCGMVIGAARTDEGHVAVVVFDADGGRQRKFWDGHEWSPSGRKWETLERQPIEVTPSLESQAPARPCLDHSGDKPSQGASGPCLADAHAQGPVAARKSPRTGIAKTQRNMPRQR